MQSYKKAGLEAAADTFYCRAVMEPGTRLLDRYVVEDVLGAGNIGRVFRARDERTSKQVAVKINVRDREDTSGRALIDALFEREQKALMLIDHPGVLRLLDRGVDDEGQPFVVTELLRGATIGALLARHGAFPEPVFAGVAVRIVSALAAAHGAGVVHRDIKPDNLFLCDDGRAVILDFGVAKGTVSSGSETMARGLSTQLVGSAHYLAPEQLQGAELSPRSDLFSLGATFFTLLAGRPPYEGATPLEVYKALLTNQRPFLKSAVPGLHEVSCELVERLMAFDPGARPADARAALPLCRPIMTRFPDAEVALQTYAADPKGPGASEGTAIVSATAIVTAQATAVRTVPSSRAEKRGAARPIAFILAGLVLLLALGGLALRPRPSAPAPVVAETPAPVHEPELAPGRAPEVPIVPDLPEAPPSVHTERRPKPSVKSSGPAVLTLQLRQWAFVAIDGVSQGKRQLAARFELAPGKHVITFTHPSLGERRRHIDLRPGKEETLVFDFNAP